LFSSKGFLIAGIPDAPERAMVAIRAPSSTESTANDRNRTFAHSIAKRQSWADIEPAAPINLDL
jgi:hypothetical protein